MDQQVDGCITAVTEELATRFGHSHQLVQICLQTLPLLLRKIQMLLQGLSRISEQGRGLNRPLLTTYFSAQLTL